MSQEKEVIEKLIDLSSHSLALAEKLDAGTDARIETGLTIAERERSNCVELIKMSLNFFGVFATIFTIALSLPQHSKQNYILLATASLASFFIFISFFTFFYLLPKKNALISKWGLVALEASNTKDSLNKVIRGNMALTQKAIDLHLEGMGVNDNK